MTVIDFLKKGISTRISFMDRWMFWKDEENKWYVMERKSYQKKTRTIITTISEEEAVKKLIEGSEEYFYN